MASDKYRITFYPSALVRMDPLELALAMANNNVLPTAKEGMCVLHVRASFPAQLERFMRDVNRADGPLIFEKVEVYEHGGYQEILTA